MTNREPAADAEPESDPIPVIPEERIGPFDVTPVRRRLQWALLHAKRVDEVVKAWAGTALVIDQELDPTTGRIRHRGRVTGDPDVDVALALSDTLHQCRAALDNLVGILRGGPTESSTFPIVGTAGEFDRRAHRDLEGVPSWAVDAIRSVQPFAAGGWSWIGGGLLELHDLARIDRHRALLLQAGVIDLDQVYVADAEGAGTTFVARNDGRQIVIETSDPTADPRFGATVLVREPTVQRPTWPGYPAAPDLALDLIGITNMGIMAIRQAAP